jgi:ABC-2 type transport system permease protein
LFIPSLVMTRQRTILGTFLRRVPAMQQLDPADPVWHFIVIVKGVFLKAMPSGEVLDNLRPLVGIATGTLSAATWLFRRRTE